MMALPDGGEEFRRGPQITVTFEANPELYTFLRCWSDEVPTLYFVDICVANITKRSRDSIEHDSRKAALFDRLKALDKPQNSFSYLLALVEKVSDPRSQLSDEKLKDQILSDVNALRAFFIKARVIEPNEFLLEYVRELRRVPHELSQQAYIQFLRSMNEDLELFNPVARSIRLKISEKILKKADSLKIVRKHPVVLLALACLYGNLSARKVLKLKASPNIFDAENALADIMIISRLLQRKLEFEQLGREGKVNFRRVEFISDDDGLTNILRCFQGETAKTERQGDVYRNHIGLIVDFETLCPELNFSAEVDLGTTQRPQEVMRSEAERLSELLFT